MTRRSGWAAGFGGAAIVAAVAMSSVLMMGQEEKTLGLTSTPGERYDAIVRTRIPMLPEGIFVTVDEPTVYTIVEDGAEVGTLIVAPLPGSTVDAEVRLTGDLVVAHIRNGWASFWGPRWPVPRTSRVAAGPRSNVAFDDTEVMAIHGPGPDDEVFVRITAPSTGTVQPIEVCVTGDNFADPPTPAPGNHVVLDQARQFTKLIVGTLGNSVSAPALVDSLPANDPLRVRIEQLEELVKVLRNAARL